MVMEYGHQWRNKGVEWGSCPGYSILRGANSLTKNILTNDYKSESDKCVESANSSLKQQTFAVSILSCNRLQIHSSDLLN